MPIQNIPTIAQRNALEGNVFLGQMREDFQQDTGLWAAGLTHPELSELVIANQETDGRFILDTYLNTPLMNGQTRSFPCYATSHGWYESDDTYQGFVVADVTGAVGAATWRIEGVRDYIYHQVGEYLMSPRRLLFRITEVGIVGGVEYVDVQKANGTVFAAGDIVVDEKLGFITNFNAEGTGQPQGREDYPYRRENNLGIIKASVEMTGSRMGNRMKILRFAGEEAPIHQGVWNTLMHMRRFRQNALMYSTKSPVGAEVVTPEGILHTIMNQSLLTTDYTVAGGAGEAQLQAFSELVTQESPTNAFLWMMGSRLFARMQQVAVTYVSSGSLTYGSFSPDQGNRLGLNVSGYTYMGVKHDFVHLKDFDDTNVTGSPLNGTPTAQAINFKEFGLALSVGFTDSATSADGQTAGIPLISYRYRVGPDGQQRNMVGGIFRGMTGAFGTSIGNDGVAPFVGEAEAASLMEQAAMKIVSTDLDVARIFWLCEVGPRVVKAKTAHGYMRAVS